MLDELDRALLGVIGAAASDFVEDLQARSAFQRIIDNRGVVATSPLYPLAIWGWLARRCWPPLPERRAAYDKFFAVRKDTDSDLPIMKAARAEAARLK